jgi:DNA-binding NarL/FixJ family response regulator
MDASAVQPVRGSSDAVAGVLLQPFENLGDDQAVGLRGAAGRGERLRPEGHHPRDLLAAVHVVANGDALLSPSITRRLIGQFAINHSSIKSCAELQRLTERETEVLRLIAKGLSNGEIAGELYLSTTTVKSHVASVLAKLGLRDRVQAVVFAYEHGVARPGL